MKALVPIACLLAGAVCAAPVAEDAVITDVSPCGFRLLWQVGEAAYPAAAVFTDAAGSTPAAGAMVDDYAGLGDYDQLLLSESGILSVEVCGLEPDTRYWVRGTATSLEDGASSDTSLLAIRTAAASQPFLSGAGLAPMANPVVRFTCLGEDGRAGAATGWLLASVEGARSAISGPVTADPTVYLEMANLISEATGRTFDLDGDEPMTLRFYRGFGEVEVLRVFAPSGGELGEVRDPRLAPGPLETPLVRTRPGPAGPARVLMEFPVTPGAYYRIESSPSMTDGSFGGGLRQLASRSDSRPRRISSTNGTRSGMSRLSRNSPAVSRKS